MRIQLGLKAWSTLAAMLFSVAVISGCNEEGGSTSPSPAPAGAPTTGGPGAGPAKKAEPAPTPPPPTTPKDEKKK